jgi:hypothetical protein
MVTSRSGDGIHHVQLNRRGHDGLRQERVAVLLPGGELNPLLHRITVRPRDVLEFGRLEGGGSKVTIDAAALARS